MSSSGQNFEFIKVSNIERVEKIIGYTFKNKALLQQALTHRSYLNEKDKNQDITEHNERLEYLGDAVLELIVSDYLYNDLDESEGKMTKLRSALVKDENTAKVGISIGLQSEILLSRGEREELGTARPSIVADVVDALLGAMYLDGGMEPSIHFIHMYILTLLPEIIEVESYNDYKTLMQEFTQKYTKITPHYKVITTEGKDHNKVYVCGLWVDNEKISEGSGKSKQIAETQAAKKSLLIMQARYKEDV